MADKQCPLLLFLDRHEATQKYRDNVENCDEGSDFIGRGSLYVGIHAAFTWDHTPEGHAYWSLLDDKFRKELRGK